jgi:hypothetical protein
MSPPTGGKYKESSAARIAGSGTSGKGLDTKCVRRRTDYIPGIAELLIFHPVDTIAKRLMSNTASVSNVGLSTIIFREHASATLGKRVMSLFPGLGYAAGYKISQRIYKFGGQPMFNDAIQGRWGGEFRELFGERKGKMIMQACAGRYVTTMNARLVLTILLFTV